MKCIDIVKWLDDKNYPLHKCYKNPRHYGYKDANAFLQDLKKYVDELSKSTLDFWCGENGGINISRCLKGLKGLDATSTEVKNLLKALTTKITASDAILDAQAIGNGLYGLQKMDATSAVVLELITILEAKMPHIEDLLLNKWVINQLSSSYISLSETIRDQTERQNFLECRFSKLGIFKNAISNYKEQFIIKLLNEHLQDNQLDLHGLDHLTVKYLLSGVKILVNRKYRLYLARQVILTMEEAILCKQL